MMAHLSIINEHLILQQLPCKKKKRNPMKNFEALKTKLSNYLLCFDLYHLTLDKYNIQHEKSRKDVSQYDNQKQTGKSTQNNNNSM